MSAQIRKLNEERGKLVHDMRSLLETATKETRNLNADEQKSYDDMFKKQNELRDSIERESKQSELEHEMKVSGGERGFSVSNGNGKEPEKEERAEFAKKAFRTFLKSGVGALTQEEIRALSAGNITEGGALVPPTQWITQLLKAVDDRTVIRAEATKFTVEKAVSLGVPVLDADPADADWTSEVGTGSLDSTMAFGQRELSPNPLAKRIKISNKLIRSSIMAVEQLVLDRLAYKFAITEEKALMTGNGVNRPLGLFTAHANGIPTSRDIAGSNTTTAIVADTLFDMKYGVKEQYQASGKWLFHRDAVKQIMKLKDSQNQYLWQPGLSNGQPDSLLNRPVLQSEYVPNTFSASSYVGMFGDFTYVWVVDALDMTVQKLVELYAETNQTGYIGRKEMDGMPVLAEAFVRCKLAAS